MTDRLFFNLRPGQPHQAHAFLKGVSSQKKESDEFTESVINWSSVVEGSWLEETLNHLRHPDQSSANAAEKILASHLKTTLRPYQLKGVQWLWGLYRLRLGGCLADDMGLGKTIQVLSLLLLAKNRRRQENALIY